jgi:hypothetical protein
MPSEITQSEGVKMEKVYLQLNQQKKNTQKKNLLTIIILILLIIKTRKVND